MSYSGDEERKILEERAPALAEMAKASTAGNLERLRIGQIYYELTARTNLTYEGIDAYLVEKHGVQMPSKSSVSRLKNVYDVWHKQSGVALADLAAFSPFLLYSIQLRTVVTARTASMWMNRMRNFTREQVLEEAAGMSTKKPKDEIAYLNFALQKEIAEMFNDARIRFAQSIGEEKLSPTAFIEFMAALIMDSDPRALRVLWGKMHGEEVEGA